MMPSRYLPITALMLLACSEESIDVLRSEQTTDYNHGALQIAVDKFVADGRTAPAFGELAKTVIALRPGMDRAVSEDAELKLLVLALAPVQSVSGKPIAAQVDALALTVWPTLLAPPIEADEIVRKRGDKLVELMPRPDETAPVDSKRPGSLAYLQRLCGGPLAAECKAIVPEYQGSAIAALAIRRATERVRIAVADCMMCSTEPGWREAVRTWEALDQLATGWMPAIERDADPENWPTAGNASAPDPGLPEARINATGEVVIGGQHYGAVRRVSALRDLRGDQTTIALHLRPELALVQLKALITDARKAGATKVAVVARVPRYPYERRIYWVADGVGTRPGLRATDSLQLLLDAVDHVAGPGATARVD